MSTRRRCQREPAPAGRRASEPAYDALTNLSAYALTLDAEYRRLDDRLFELASSDPEVEAVRAVLRERKEIDAERDAFRRAVTALREQVTQGPRSGR
jgi:hypothetical protein